MVFSDREVELQYFNDVIYVQAAQQDWVLGIFSNVYVKEISCYIDVKKIHPWVPIQGLLDCRTFHLSPGVILQIICEKPAERSANVEHKN